MASTDYISQIAVMRANARPQAVMGSGQPLTSTAKSKTFDNETFQSTVKGVQESLGNTFPIFKSPAQLRTEAEGAWKIANTLPDDVRKAITMDPDAQKARRRQARYAPELFGPADVINNDPSQKGMLEFTTQIKDLAGQEAQAAQKATAKGEEMPERKQKKAEAEGAELANKETKARTSLYGAQEEGLKVETSINEAIAAMKKIDVSSYSEEKQLEIQTKIADLEGIKQNIVASKSAVNLNEEAAPGERQLTQEQILSQRQDRAESVARIKNMEDTLAAEIAKTYSKDATEDTKFLMETWTKDQTAIAEKYKDTITEPEGARGYAVETLERATNLTTQGFGKEQVQVTLTQDLGDYKKGEKVYLEVPNALGNPTAMYATSKAIDEGYAAFSNLDQQAKYVSDYGNYASEMLDIYDAATVAYNSLTQSTDYFDTDELGLTTKLSSLVGAYNKLQYMRWVIYFSGKVVPPEQAIAGLDAQGIKQWQEERAQLSGQYAYNTPAADYKNRYTMLASGIASAIPFVEVPTRTTEEEIERSGKGVEKAVTKSKTQQIKASKVK